MGEAEEFLRRALELEWLLCDVDGVLTDGGLYYDDRGHRLLRFDARDGLGFQLAQRAGLRVGLLSGRASIPAERRARELGLDAFVGGAADKGRAFDAFLEEHAVRPEQVAFAGDDLPDLAILARCGLSFSPGDAVEPVRAAVDRVLSCRGGRGAIREMVEILLRARGSWEDVCSAFAPAAAGA
ncbi:MAG: HAD family hydrolase [Proteobacteria bacterium]|nr:HAD family hydrolase [Pseudomonadota bacterium]